MWITNILNTTQTVQSIRIRLKSWTTVGDGSSLVLNISQGYIISNPQEKISLFFEFCFVCLVVLFWAFSFEAFFFFLVFWVCLGFFWVGLVLFFFFFLSFGFFPT